MRRLRTIACGWRRSPLSGGHALGWERVGMIAALALAPALALGAATSGVASADFTRASLLSGTVGQQFEEANAPALSADGGYAVFQGKLAGVPGVYRRELQTGAITQVAGGDAAAPSVSADGRYVAFTTTVDLDPQAEPTLDKSCPEVYVRDMDVGPGEPGEYTLAAALNGTSEGVAYAGGCAAPESSGFRLAGAQAAPGVALSADGRHVVFTILGYSNLTTDCGGPPEYKECAAPGQVAIRDLATDTTMLVTATPGGQPTPGGGAFPSTETLAESSARLETVGLARFQTRYGDQAAASSAAISADASTVAWLGTNVPAQVSPLEAERAPRLGGPSAPGREAEPLWRRVADGSGAVTRRLLAGAGLDFFYQRGVVEVSDPVTSGSLVGKRIVVFIPPALSADGRTVGVLASAPPSSLESSLDERVNTEATELNTDAYVVRVAAGSAGAPAVTPITAIASYALPNAATEDVKDVAISPDGTRVAFDTLRTQLLSPSLALISPPTAFTQTAETYEANLELGTLQRVTSTYDGSEPNGDAGLLSFAGDGQTLAFASRATNLFFGDGVPAWEVYQTQELPSQATAAVEEIGAMPNPAPPVPGWLLSVTATAEPDGSVLVDARAPGAGRLTVKAGAQLPEPVPSAHGGKRAKRARKTSIASVARGATASKEAAGRARRRKPGERGAGTAIPTHTVAQASATARAPAEIRLRVRVGSAYRALVADRNGLYAVLRVTFAAPGHRTLVEEVPVTFRRAKRRPAPHKRAARGRVKR